MNRAPTFADVVAHFRNNRFWLICESVVLLATALATSAANLVGAATSNDTAFYFSAAENLVGGAGLVVDVIPQVARPGSANPLAVWPPAYPVLLAMGASLGLSVDAAAKVITGIAGGVFAVSVLAIASIICRHKWWALLAGALAVTNAAVWSRIPYALSETPFMAFMYGGILCLAVVSDEQSPCRQRTRAVLLVLGACCLGVAALTRLIGISLLLGAATFGILRSWRARTVWPGLWLVLLASLPVVAWFGWARSASGYLTGFAREGFGNATIPLVRAFLSDLRPTSPFGLGLSRSPAGVALVAAAGLLVLVGLVRGAARLTTRPTLPSFGSLTGPVGLCVCVGMSYCVSLFALGALGRFWPPDASRNLTPIYPMVIVLAVCWIGRIALCVQPSAARATVIACMGLLTFLQVGSAAKYTEFAMRDGLGFNSSYWRASATMNAIDDLATGAATASSPVLASNIAPGVWLRYREPVRRLDDVTPDGLCAFRRPVSGPIVMVFFALHDPRWLEPSFRDLAVRSVETCSGGSALAKPTADGFLLILP